MKKVTAGRDALGDFAPKFAELNLRAVFLWGGRQYQRLYQRGTDEIGNSQFENCHSESRGL